MKKRCNAQVRLPRGSTKPAFHGVLRYTFTLNDSCSKFATFVLNETTLQPYLRLPENWGYHVVFTLAEVSRLLQDKERDIVLKIEAHFDRVLVVRREESLSNHRDVVFANILSSDSARRRRGPRRSREHAISTRTARKANFSTWVLHRRKQCTLVQFPGRSCAC